MGIVTQKKDMLKNIEQNNRDKNAVIAEIKVHSPQYGNLLGNRKILGMLRIFESSGAAGISYITEPNHFRGELDIFKKICRESCLPVLRKDFILSRAEIERTAEADASAILLIARILKEDTGEFVDYAIQHGLNPLVEVHTPEDIEIAEQTNARLIGINNRDIQKLETDGGTVNLTERLSSLVPDDRLIVSESGIHSIQDLKKVLKYSQAVLVGTAFMRAENTYDFVKSFVEAK
ncbi:MAG: indole-3-glycerol phosphate synthase TrpC [Archaeoglobaceae archaeon]